ncbi:hypothetical protein AGMMS49546_38300 [Spirochaetia bacterium]|nr:hypothetical protein AGMMS49546_38300 [Spirochaetia bacterium]
MRKLGILFLGLVLFAFASCKSVDFTSNESGAYNMAPVATKDFTILGPVSLTATDTTVVSFFAFNTTHTGSTVTAALLLEEAKKLGADEVINVRIDKYDNHKESPLDRIVGYTRVVEYKGYALAIKYGATIQGAAATNATSGIGGSGDAAAGGLLGFLPF